MDAASKQAIELGMLALVVGREAMNQPYQAMLGVAWSIRNRATKPCYWGTDWCSVIFHKFAYSSMTNFGDPNLVKGPDFGIKAWESIAQAAATAYQGLGDDPVQGATHYHSEMPVPPAWATAPSTKFITQIGAFKFYSAS